MGTARTLRHLCTGRAALRRAFPRNVLAAIEQAVARAEAGRRGEIRFVAEAALDPIHLWHGHPARERAIEVFGRMRVWDTEHNCGVLIYVLLADRSVEIVADRGIAQHVPQAEWDAICTRMQEAFRDGRFEAGAVEGVASVGALLDRHFAARPGSNELPDAPVLI